MVLIRAAYLMCFLGMDNLPNRHNTLFWSATQMWHSIKQFVQIFGMYRNSKVTINIKHPQTPKSPPCHMIAVRCNSIHLLIHFPAGQVCNPKHQCPHFHICSEEIFRSAFPYFNAAENIFFIPYVEYNLAHTQV